MRNCLNKSCLIILILFAWALPRFTLANEGYPKIANYYLNWFDSRYHDKLSKYDLLILQPEMIYLNGSFFDYYHRKQPNGKLLAYLYPSSFYREAVFYDSWSIRSNILHSVDRYNWWLRDERGEIVIPWPKTSMINIVNDDWQRFNLEYLHRVYRLDKWDGLFWDLVDSEASRYSRYSLDVDGDGVSETSGVSNKLWQEGMRRYFDRVKLQYPDKIKIINGNSLSQWQDSINGRLFEHFPTPWEASGSWQDSMRQYLYYLPGLNQKPNVYIINARYDNQDGRDIYQQMRFGLGSTMLGDGYFSFDSGANSHGELWWFDEYDLNLGQALETAYNTTADTQTAEPGLWRREFSRGLVLVNSDSRSHWVSLPKGTYKRFRGAEDPVVNSGCSVNLIRIKSKDAVILVK